MGGSYSTQERVGLVPYLGSTAVPALEVGVVSELAQAHECWKASPVSCLLCCAVLHHHHHHIHTYGRWDSWPQGHERGRTGSVPSPVATVGRVGALSHLGSRVELSLVGSRFLVGWLKGVRARELDPPSS